MDQKQCHQGAAHIPHTWKDLAAKKRFRPAPKRLCLGRTRAEVAARKAQWRRQERGRRIRIWWRNWWPLVGGGVFLLVCLPFLFGW